MAIDKPPPENSRVVEILKDRPREIPRAPGPETVIAALHENGRGFSLSDAGEHFLLRFFGMCEFEISRNLDKIRPFREPSLDEAWVATFLGSSVFGHLLALAGEPYLHAAAVSFPEGVIALTGSSGAGKSTLAAVLCSAGGVLVTDDLLRLDLSGPQPQSCVGSQQLRLKPNAAGLAGTLGRRTGQSPDLRATVDMRADVACSTLKAIAVPKPSRNLSRLTVDRMGPREAFMSLANASLVAAWREPNPLQQRFTHIAGIVERVPVYAAHTPWGPPFEAEVAAGFRRLLREEIA